MKKIALSVVLSSTLVVPWVVVSSCSSSNSTQINYTISTKTSPKIEIEDLKGVNYKSLETLEKLFDGIDANNIDFFEVLIDSEMNKKTLMYKITLEAKPGYSINGEQKLQSNIFSLASLSNFQIEVKNNPQVDRVDIEGENFQSLATLEKLFSGVTEVNIDKFHVSMRRDITKPISTYKITLTAKEGYTINGEKFIDSKEFTIEDIVLNITPKNNPELDKIDIQILNDGIQNNDLEVLVKLFDGIDETNINFTTNSLVSNMVTLNTKSGYIFSNDLNSITVNFKIVDVLVEITPKPGPIELTQQELNSLLSLNNKIPVLKKLFNGIGETTIPWLNHVSQNDFRVKLEASFGYIFPSGETVEQNIIVVKNTRNSEIKNNTQNFLWDSPIILSVLVPNKFSDKLFCFVL